ncbi:MAG: polysaccharide deacetylase family protein [Rhodospirillaceae bacterium]
MNAVTLTFDNGPDAAVTPRVLDILAAHGVLATFFVVGERLAASAAARAAVERARAAGHWIGNHSFTHTTPLGQLGGDAARDEIERA